MPKKKLSAFEKLMFREHSLSIAVSIILAIWIIAYCLSDDQTHLGSFFGNAIADWSGLLITVFITKYMYEKGSLESRRPPHRLLRPIPQVLRDHSLSIFLIITGIGWAFLYSKMNPEARWGNVVGNLLSEWTQILGVVLLTKKLREIHSKE